MSSDHLTDKFNDIRSVQDEQVEPISVQSKAMEIEHRNRLNAGIDGSEIGYKALNNQTHETFERHREKKKSSHIK